MWSNLPVSPFYDPNRETLAPGAADSFLYGLGAVVMQKAPHLKFIFAKFGTSNWLTTDVGSHFRFHV